MLMRTCAQCKFNYAPTGECRHDPPVRLPRRFVSSQDRTRDEELIWSWPKVGPMDWCGKYEDS